MAIVVRSVLTRFSIGLLALVLAAAFVAGGIATGGIATGGDWQQADTCDTGPTNSC